MKINKIPYLAEIMVYPIKSTHGLSQSHTWVGKQGIVFDRLFMVTREDGAMITAREYPQLLNVTTTLLVEGLYLSYKNGEQLLLKYCDFEMLETPTNVFKDRFNAFTTTKNANKWFSAILGVPAQLLFTGEESKRTRESIPYNISFADGYPLLILSNASLAALNERSIESFSMTSFRPNLIISGTNEFEEDSWKRIRIGDVVLEGVKPCTRCIMTTIDQKTGLFDEKKEPLNTLSKFRSDEVGNIKFGHNLVVINEGIIKVGDVIEVLERKPPEKFHINISSTLVLSCVKREDIARDFCTFWFKSEKNNSLPPYFPGQHLPITVKIGGKYYSRRYTLSSTPTRPGLYAISIKRVTGGFVSNWMHDHFQVGQKLTMETPAGEFYLDRAVDKILLVAAGSGITPIISMLRYLYDKKSTADVYLYYQCRTREDIAFKLELDHLQTVNPNLHVRIVLSQPDVLLNSPKRIFDINVLSDISDLMERQVFICGPDKFMKSAQCALFQLGLPASHYHQEKFGITILSQSVVSPITLTVNGTSFVGDNQQPLLLQAEKAGLPIPYGCRAGFCGECKVRLVSGRVDQQSFLPQPLEGKKSDYVLACCSIPITDVKIISM